MTIRTSILAGAVFLVGATFVAHAQPQYAAGYPPYPPSVAAPPAWSYDPYTSGLGPCPQRYPTEPPCSQTIQPTYGQPSFWPTR